jgi:hypothetical protein
MLTFSGLLWDKLYIEWYSGPVLVEQVLLQMRHKCEKYMDRCLELASIAKSNGKTAVGSLVVKGTQIMAEGIEARAAFQA